MRAILIMLLAATFATAGTPDRAAWKAAWYRARQAATVNPLDGYPKQDNIVAYYPFNGNALDESGSGNNGTTNGAVIISTDYGISGQGIDFDGSTGMVKLNATVVPSGAKTISMWINADVATTGYLICNYNASTTSGFSLLFNNTRRVGMTWSATINVVQTAALTLDAWHNVCAVFETGATGGQIYVNGVLASSANLGTEAYATNLAVRLSGRYTTGETGNAVMYNGSMDQVLIWNTALSSNEVYQVYEYDAP